MRGGVEGCVWSGQNLLGGYSMAEITLWCNICTEHVVCKKVAVILQRYSIYITMGCRANYPTAERENPIVIVYGRMVGVRKYRTNILSNFGINGISLPAKWNILIDR